MKPEKRGGASLLAFTLAEVLITLAIIGIVAAMTIPTLIHNFQVKALQSQFKTTYSLITQAYGMMKANSSLPSLYGYYTVYAPESGYYRTDEFNEEFKKYIKVQSKIINSNDLIYLTYDGSKKYESDNLDYYNISKPDLILANGAYLKYFISASLDGRAIIFLVDINGEKGPNRAGHDYFHFIVADYNDVVTGKKMTKLYTDEELENDDYAGMRGFPCSIKSKQVANGMGCADYAVKDICPDDPDKGYWECLPK